ncbi:DNA-binding protein [Kangiella profundi]|uniref:DNA-binding protein n=1 Tax=Kangiella profundi TaxID=1561924 RepID=A0A2K9B0N5_9GAMM|nr:helix-hairpin-helix domain-containing protein [Kangiella profundi]AUD78488.1 DNA-binding protein [Kangiella profundi]GGF08295.1 hypothetical protein GCM10011356_22300 [Kangiella profundi]
MKKIALLLSLVLAVSSQTLFAKERGGLSAANGKGSTEQALTVNINSADAKELSRVLTGVGMKKAEAIIEYREKFGPFKSANELTAVKGIGEKTVEKNKSKIKL